MSPRGPLLLWSAGDPSGDRHAARVVEAIRARRPDVRSVGLGGPAMAAAGVELVASIDEVAAVGISDVLARWRQLLGVRRRLLDLLAGRGGRGRPSLFVPVDFPGLNLRLSRRARRAGVPVVYFIAPQVWAWGAGRMAAIRAIVRRMLVLFDFEVEIYAGAGVPVTLVGHPLVEQSAAVPERAAARARLGLAPGARVLVLMPGSRRDEIRRHLGPMLGVARRLGAELGRVEIVIRLAAGLEREPVEEAVRAAGLHVLVAGDGDSAAVVAADVALVAAGTATLETALLGTPMVIVYRVSALTFAIARRLVRVPSLGLVNLIAGRQVAPEFIQDAVEEEAVTRAVASLFTDAEVRRLQLEGLAEVRGRLGGPGAAARAASAILDELEATGGGAGGGGAAPALASGLPLSAGG